MRYLTFDQAKHCGWALFEDDKLLHYGVEVLASEKTTYENVLLPARKFADKLIKETKADIVILEAVQFQSNQATYSKLSMLLGTLLCLFKENEILFEVVQATKWKSYCGIKGQKREEQKENTIRFVKEKFNIDVGSDEADAIALGFYAVNNIRVNATNAPCTKGSAK